MLKVRVLVTVVLFDSDRASVTALDQSWLAPTVTDAIGPRSIHPAVASTETPWLLVMVVDFSFVSESEAETDMTGDRSQDSPPLQLNVLPSTCCCPALV